MNKDFHYYATYLAARVAGYTKAEAETIAYAAQYVDDFTPSQAKTLMEARPKIPVQVTCEDSSYLSEAWKNIRWGNEYYFGKIGIWSFFHFLPGNFKENSELVYPYQGKEEYDWGGVYPDLWTYKIGDNKQEEELFKTICLQDSLPVYYMVNNVKENVQQRNEKNKKTEVESQKEIKLQARDQSINLIQIGLTMHVLADTWAHSNFSGVPAWFLNNGKCNKLLNISSPPTSGFNSLMYLGHAKLGHLPDYPNQVYEYTPQWRSEGAQAFERNNPDLFTTAFAQLAYAMRCIKINHEFKCETKYVLDDDTFNEELRSAINQIHPLFRTDQFKEEENCIKGWKKAFNDKLFKDSTGNPIECPIDYVRTQWKKRFDDTRSNPSERLLTEHYIFNECAIEHKNLISELLNKYNVCVEKFYDSRKKNIRFCTSKQNLHAYKKYKYSFFNPSRFINADYPTTNSTNYQEIKLIRGKNSSESLCSGEVVQLCTTEEGDACLMTRTKLRDCVYYEAKGYGTGIQNWLIFKAENILKTTEIQDKISENIVYIISCSEKNRCDFTETCDGTYSEKHGDSTIEYTCSHYSNNTCAFKKGCSKQTDCLFIEGWNIEDNCPYTDQDFLLKCPKGRKRSHLKYLVPTDQKYGNFLTVMEIAKEEKTADEITMAREKAKWIIHFTDQ